MTSYFEHLHQSVSTWRQGYGKPTYKDQRKYYYIAMGSLRECEAIIIMENIQEAEILETMDQLGASLFKLCHSNSSFLTK